MRNKLFRLLFPDRCIFCDTVLPLSSEGLPLCAPCRQKLSLCREGGTCEICGRPVGSGQRLCGVCAVHRPKFDFAVAACVYEGDLQRAIVRNKYHNRPDYAEAFAQLLLDAILARKDFPRPDFVTCIPSGPKRLKERGYNQTELPAALLAKSLGVPFCPEALYKQKDLPSQTEYGYPERLRNVAGAFAANPKADLAERCILLVDDVLTTGATASEAAQTLKQAGAASVIVAAVAATRRVRRIKKN